MGHHVEETFRCDRSEVTRARHLVADALQRWEIADAVPDMELAVSELMAAAVRRPADAIRLELSMAEGALRLEVHEIRPGATPPDTEGLWFIDDVADARGVIVRHDGIVTWMTRRLPSPHPC